MVAHYGNILQVSHLIKMTPVAFVTNDEATKKIHHEKVKDLYVIETIQDPFEASSITEY